MNVDIAAFIDGLWQAAAIWLTLIVSAFLALLGLLGRPKRPKVITSEQVTRGRALKHARLLMRAEALDRYARDTEQAAHVAAEKAQRRREEWIAAQREAETAWHSYDRADLEARKVIFASLLPRPDVAIADNPAEYAFRERYLHRRAMAACSHRELSALELSDALAHRNGWNPLLHPFDQDVAVRRAVRENLLAGYRAAADREQKAWQDADTAAAEATRLHSEAALAAEKAMVARISIRPARSASRARARQLVHWGSRVRSLAAH
jgi:hypothetical protein